VVDLTAVVAEAAALAAAAPVVAEQALRPSTFRKSFYRILILNL